MSIPKFENPMLLGEELRGYTKYLEGNKDFVITYLALTRHKELNAY